MLKLRVLLPFLLNLGGTQAHPRMRLLQGEKNEQSICHIPPADPSLFKTLNVDTNVVNEYLMENPGDIVGSCESQCDRVCDDGDQCHENVDTAMAETCTCLSKPSPIAPPSGEKCCAPHGMLIPQEACCPVGVDECCGMKVEDCYDKVNPFALEFMMAVLGDEFKLEQTSPLAFFDVNPSLATNPEVGSSHVGTTVDSLSFEFRILEILLTADDVVAEAESPAVPKEWAELVAALEDDPDFNMDEEGKALMSNFQEPASKEELQDLREGKSIITIITCEAAVKSSSYPKPVIEFVALINGRVDEVTGSLRASLMVIGDPSLFVEKQERQRSLIGVNDCQATYDALLAAAEANLCKDPEVFKHNAACGAAVVAACETDMQTALNIYNAAVQAAKIARDVAIAAMLVLKARQYALALQGCTKIILPWALAACIAAAIIFIELKAAATRRAIEAILRAALALALQHYEKALQLALNALTAAASACWKCECDPNKCCPSCNGGETCCLEIPSAVNEGGTCISKDQCCPNCTEGFKCCKGNCIPVGQECSPDVRMDPHFTTFSGERYDYHGECDLVVLHNPGYKEGLGMDIHVRTQIRSFYSYVKTAVVRIGAETFEVTGAPVNKFWLNGKEDVELPARISGHVISHHTNEEHRQKYFILLGGNNERIEIVTYKFFVSVSIRNPSDEKFAGSMGLMGSYETGQKVGRDGHMVFDNPNEFGLEWQVNPLDLQLFRQIEGPQHPEKCILPDVTPRESRQRRLDLGDAISEEQAKRACARVKPHDFDLCVFDVLATNDEDMAGAY